MGGEYILVAEDNSGDVFLIREALDPLGIPLRVFADGDEAIAAIDALDADPSQPAPVLALLDLNLPKRPGLDVLRRLRGSRNIGGTPVECTPKLRQRK